MTTSHLHVAGVAARLRAVLLVLACASLAVGLSIASLAPVVVSRTSERVERLSLVTPELPQTAPNVVVAAAPEPVQPPAPPERAMGALPIGKGMWIWLPERADGGDAAAIVDRATAVGLTHIFVRTGSSKRGFYAQTFLDAILPAAHANSIRVYGWDFPYLDSPASDVRRGVAAISYATPDGHRLDGFNADIETEGEGTNITTAGAVEYGSSLRAAVGDSYPLIVTVPNPTPAKVAGGYPYAEVVASFDAVSPMIYWLNRQPGSDTANAMQFLAPFGKPVFPIGQAYDGESEGGRPGVPPPEELVRFMQVAEAYGAAGVSFWSWQHADQAAWDAIRDATEFKMHAGPPGEMTAAMLRSYQTLLNRMGYLIVADGLWGAATEAVVATYQEEARLPASGYIDEATADMLLLPVSPATD